MEKETASKKDKLSGGLRLMEIVESELERQKGEAIFCLVFFIILLCIWIMLEALWYELDKPLSPKTMTAGVELIAVLMLVVVLKFTHFDLSKMGVTKKNLKPSIIRAGIISSICVAVMLAAKLIIRPGQPLLNPSLFSLAYIITALFQEYLARGFLVTVLLTMIPSPKAGLIAVISSSLIFACLHLHYGIVFMAAACVLSVLLGLCYLKDENIWGVSIIHFVIGMAGIMLELV